MLNASAETLQISQRAYYGKKILRFGNELKMFSVLNGVTFFIGLMKGEKDISGKFDIDR